MKFFVILIFSVLFGLSGFAENPLFVKLHKSTKLDKKLRNEVENFISSVKKAPSEENLLDLEKIGNWMFLNDEAAFSLEIANVGNQNSKKLNFPKGEFYFQILTANLFTEKGNFHEADSVFGKLKKLAVSLDLNGDLQFGVAKANYLASIGEKLEAIKIYERVGRSYKNSDEDNYAVILCNIGEIYKDLGLFNQAIFNLTRALQIYQKLNNPKRQTLIHQHLSQCYMRNDQLDSAIVHLKMSLQTGNFHPQKVEMARFYSTLSNIQRRKKEFKQAHFYVDSSVCLAKMNDFPIGVLINQLNKSEIFFDEGKYREALQILDSIQPTLSDFNSKEIKLEFLRIKGNSLERLGRIKDAIEYKNSYIELQNEISKAQNTSLILEIGNSLSKEISRSELEQLNDEIEKEQNRNWWITMVLLSSITISALSFRAWRIQKKKNELEVKLVKEEEELVAVKEELEKKARIIESMEQISEVGFLQKVLEEVQELKSNSKGEVRNAYMEVLQILKKGDSQTVWKDFELSYSGVHEEFFNRLKEICPQLTPNEIKICSLIRLNLSTKEIAQITHRTPGRIDNIRSIIRKKINLEADKNLTTFLMEIC